MTIEKKLTDVVESANRLTDIVTKKISDIDAHVHQANGRVNEFIESAIEKIPYINLFKNSFAQQTDNAGNLIFPLAVSGVSLSARVISYNDIPEVVKVTVPAKFSRFQVGPINAMHIVFRDDETPNIWLPGNPTHGFFSGGFGHVYVVSGSMRGLTAGQSGSVIERKWVNWHIDMTFRATAGTEVYLFAPFVVAGNCPNPELVQYIQSRAVNLGSNNS